MQRRYIETVTVGQAATLLKVCQKTIRRAIDRGELPLLPHRRREKLLLADVEAFKPGRKRRIVSKKRGLTGQLGENTNVEAS